MSFDYNKHRKEYAKKLINISVIFHKDDKHDMLAYEHLKKQPTTTKYVKDLIFRDLIRIEKLRKELNE